VGIAGPTKTELEARRSELKRTGTKWWTDSSLIPQGRLTSDTLAWLDKGFERDHPVTKTGKRTKFAREVPLPEPVRTSVREDGYKLVEPSRIKEPKPPAREVCKTELPVAESTGAVTEPAIREPLSQGQVQTPPKTDERPNVTQPNEGKIQKEVLYEIRPIKALCAATSWVDGNEIPTQRLVIVGYEIVRTIHATGKEKVIATFRGDGSKNAARRALCDWIPIEDGTEITDENGKRYRITKDTSGWYALEDRGWRFIINMDITECLGNKPIQTVKTTKLRWLSEPSRMWMMFGLAAGVVVTAMVGLAILVVNAPKTTQNQGSDAAPDAQAQQQDAGAGETTKRSQRGAIGSQGLY